MLIGHQVISFWILAWGNLHSCPWHREHWLWVRGGDPPGEVPELWQKVTITPVFKKASKEDPGNHKPINFTFIPRKVVEQLIQGALPKPEESPQDKGDCGIPEVSEAAQKPPELGSQSCSALAGAFTQQGSPRERLEFTQHVQLSLAL